MKVMHINITYDYGSTGRFIRYIKEALEKQGDTCKVICSFSKGVPDGVQEIQSAFISKFEIILGRILGNHGLNCYLQTIKAIHILKEYKPDIIHLHNLHGDYINFEMLFNYIKKNDIPVVWKLPDCWAFTGHCTYYDYVNCYRWKENCGNCPQMKQYPFSWFRDNSSNMLRKKIMSFSNVKRMIITPPSEWLRKEVEQSFLKQYEIKVVNNGTDLEAFYPLNNEKVKMLKRKGNIIVLGVIFCFDVKKGLDYFNYLAEKLPDKFDIIIVGFKDQAGYMNKRIKLVDRTENITELAEYYSAADVFVNPTLEENFPSVNIEALACGTPIVAFNTGGATEAFSEKTGIIVERGNKEELLKQVIFVGENKPFNQKDCVERAKLFTKEKMIQNYINLYKKITH